MTDILLPAAFNVLRLEAPEQMHLSDPETEKQWLPIVGPSVWVLAQRLLRYPVGKPILVGRDEFAYSLGLSPRRLEAVVTRAIRFQWADWHERTNRLYVVSSVDPPNRQPMRREYPEGRGVAREA